MALRLIVSDNDRAVAIRDHIVPLLRERGTLEVQRDEVRITVLRTDPWVFRHWTPFNELSPHEASSPGYRRAIERQHKRRDLGYGFEVWHSGARVLLMLWADDGRVDVSGFVRGDWEDAALAL